MCMYTTALHFPTCSKSFTMVPKEVHVWFPTVCQHWHQHLFLPLKLEDPKGTPERLHGCWFGWSVFGRFGSSWHRHCSHGCSLLDLSTWSLKTCHQGLVPQSNLFTYSKKVRVKWLVNHPVPVQSHQTTIFVCLRFLNLKNFSSSQDKFLKFGDSQKASKSNVHPLCLKASASPSLTRSASPKHLPT